VQDLSSDEKKSSGIPGLDEMLFGGFPAGRVILVVGGPGTGKTIMAAQFLVEGIRSGESGVFVSLDESKDHFFSEMAKLDWNMEKFERDRRLAFVDASPIRHLPGEVKLGKVAIGKRDFSMLSLIEGINAAAKEIDAKRVAVDPIASLIFQYPDAVQRRTAMLDLNEALIRSGATCLLTTELRSIGIERRVQIEEYLAHGVVILQTMQVGRSFVRVLQVEKMRESDVDAQPRPYRISNRGIEVFPKESVF